MGIAVFAISFGTISLMWEPPPKQEQNGIIMGYVVTVTMLGNGESFQLFSSNNTITLDSLRPYTTYVCVVAAQTSAGIGPVSIGIQVRTNESCELFNNVLGVEFLKCRFAIILSAPK